jgi:hypothetical protein
MKANLLHLKIYWNIQQVLLLLIIRFQPIFKQEQNYQVEDYQKKTKKAKENID